MTSRLGMEKPITFFYSVCSALGIRGLDIKPPHSSFTLSLHLPRTSPTVGGVLGLSLVPHSSSIGERPSTGTLHPVSGRLVVLAQVTVSGNMLILIVFEKILNAFPYF